MARQHINNNDALGLALFILIPVVLYLLYSAYRAKQQMRNRRKGYKRRTFICGRSNRELDIYYLYVNR